MSKPKKVVLVGLGEVGRPIFELASKHHNVFGVDITAPTETVPPVDILHICFPFGIDDFVGETMRYIELFKPALTIINSTVAVGTTRLVASRTGTPVVNSPVRGKHAHMTEDLLCYVKFVGAVHASEGEHAAEHFRSLGMKTTILSSPEATELAKLTETTYFGLMIAWAQEVERYCDQLDQNYDEVTSFYEQIGFFPPMKYFPGVIGGHCVMPNIKILKRLGPSEIVQAIVSSNEAKIEREAQRARTDAGGGDAISRVLQPTA
jgi:UDP-N-acetyl-D-mannosaminuronate dehydrogenase